MRNSAIITVLAVAVILTPEAPIQAEPLFEQSDVFAMGLYGVDTYRIPAVIVTQKGTVLAFCEARKQSIVDQTPTDMVLRRSFDNGKTWQPMQVLLAGKNAEAVMNPCPVIDRRDGKIFLFCSFFPDQKSQNIPAAVRQLYLASTDDGATWSAPVDISEQISDTKTWATLCSGPAVGIQTTTGRLVVPFYHWQGGTDRNTVNGIFYSDDHGKTWTSGENVHGYANENTVVELTDGCLMLNSRMVGPDSDGFHHRKISKSCDGGLTWSKTYNEITLITPGCQACLLRYTKIADGRGKNRLLFSGPASRTSRVNMTVRISYDEADTWPVAKTVNPGGSAYSCLTVTKDGAIGLLYENGKKVPCERISFARFNLEWLTDGKDRQ